MRPSTGAIAGIVVWGLGFWGLIGSVTATPIQGGRGRGGGADPVESIREIKPGLYMIPGGGANTVVRLTSEGLILVDTKNPNPGTYERIMEEIRTVTDQPVRYVINTHHHGDHTGNNALFVDAGAVVIGLEALRDNMVRADATGVPMRTFERDHVLELGGVRVEAHHYGGAHTGGDTIVHFPDLGVVMLTDTVTTDRTPIADAASGGSALGWPSVLERVMALEFDTAIAGRGDPISKADVGAFKTRFETVLSRARAAVDRGVGREELGSRVQTADLGWQFNARFWDALYDEIVTGP
jgi:cyclase